MRWHCVAHNDTLCNHHTSHIAPHCISHHLCGLGPAGGLAKVPQDGGEELRRVLSRLDMTPGSCWGFRGSEHGTAFMVGACRSTLTLHLT